MLHRKLEDSVSLDEKGLPVGDVPGRAAAGCSFGKRLVPRAVVDEKAAPAPWTLRIRIRQSRYHKIPLALVGLEQLLSQLRMRKAVRFTEEHYRCGRRANSGCACHGHWVNGWDFD